MLCYRPDDKNHIASMKFRMVEHMMRRIIERRVSNTGVYRSQHQLLAHLCHHSNYSQADLAEQLEISPAAVAVSLKKLEKGGYIVRESKENDNRANLIQITEKGNEVIKNSISIFTEVEQRTYDGFTEEEMEMLNAYFDRMYDNLEKYHNELKQKQ